MARRVRHDWTRHIEAYHASGLSVAEYCREAGIKVGTFRVQLSRQRKQDKNGFQEFTVSSDLTISRDPRGGLIVRGIDPADLAAVIGAWYHAVSR
jgi:hypothetical protein